MKIDVQRLAILAGLNKTDRMLSESVATPIDEFAGKIADEMEEVDSAMDEMEEMDSDMSEMDHDLEEILEIDEVMLVQELRRAKQLMSESKKRSQESLQETELKRIIETEVANVLKDLNLNASWVYGKNKPKASKPGYSHQGSFLKGIGFK